MVKQPRKTVLDSGTIEYRLANGDIHWERVAAISHAVGEKEYWINGKRVKETDVNKKGAEMYIKNNCKNIGLGDSVKEYVTTEQCKMIDILGKRYYTAKKKEKKETKKLIESFFKKYFTKSSNASGSLLIHHKYYINSGGLLALEFSGNIKFSSLARQLQKRFDPVLALRYIAEVRHGKHKQLQEHSWVLPECREKFLMYLGGGESNYRLYISNTKHIYFDAKKREVSIEYKHGDRYSWKFSAEELM